MKGRFTIILLDKFGRLKSRQTVDNLIVNSGYQLAVDIWLNGTAVKQLDGVGIGWGAGSTTAPALTQTDLQGAGKDVVTGGSLSLRPKGFIYTKAWNAGEPAAAPFPITINEVAAFSIGGAPEMYSRSLISPTVKQNADVLLIAYEFHIDEVL